MSGKATGGASRRVSRAVALTAAAALAAAVCVACGDDAPPADTTQTNEAAADVRSLTVEESGADQVVSATVVNPTSDTVDYILTVTVFDQATGTTVESTEVRVEDVAPNDEGTGESDPLEDAPDNASAVLTNIERVAQ